MRKATGSRFLAIAAALVTMAGQLHAAQINGLMNFNGTVTLNTASAGTANRVTGWFGPNGNPNVAGATGDFAGFVTPGTSTAAFPAPWFFSSAAIPGFAMAGGFTFNLTESHITVQTSSAVTVSGTGFITGNGYDPTPGVWTFTTQNPAAAGRFSFSASIRAVPCTGQIGDFVWQDDNHNGCQDPGELGIPGVQVDLYQGCVVPGGVPFKTTMTDGNGKYLFDGLCAGTYTVGFHTPAGYTHTLANQSCNVSGQPADETDSDCDCVGTGDCGVCVTLPSNISQDLTIDCGYIPPCTGQIGDFVWQDNNGNGCQDPGDLGIAGVQVDLYQGCVVPGGVPFRTTTTDGSGKYLFTGLCAGTYTVGFHTPAGYTRTLANQSCNVNGQPADETDSDCDCVGTGDCGVCVTLPTNNSQDLTIDCGYISLNCLTVQKNCEVPQPVMPFDCSGAKPIKSLMLKWNGATSPIWVRAWNGAINGSGVAQSTFGPITTGSIVTFTRSGTYPNDVYFEIFTCSAMTSACKLGNSTFHTSCSDVDMNGPEDCNKAEGDGKGQVGYINDWKFEGMAGDNSALVCNPAPPPPSNDCMIQNTPVDCTNQSKPTSLTFQYTPGGCPASNNQQPSGKFECNDVGFDSTLPIAVGQNDQVGLLKGSQSYTIINDDNGNPVSAANPVFPGGTFTVSFGGKTFNAQSYFALINQGGGGTEYVDIHTSCSQPLAVGDVFGSMTLVGFNGQEGGNDVTFKYTVTNNCTRPLNVTLTDNKLGPICSTTLDPNSFAICMKMTHITETTTNIVTASAPGAQDATATAHVTVVGPPLACVTGASSLTLSKKEVQWKLTNGTSTLLQISKITISWPNANGYLDQLKLDGAKISDGDFNPPSTMITTFSGSTGDRSVDKNKSRTLHFIFQNTAVSGSYSITVEFTNGCVVTFP